MRRWIPWIYPVIEVTCLAGALAVGESRPWVTLGLLALAALTLCFALHVSYHEWVHQGHPGGALGELAISALMGLPLDGYRWHHLNHHRHENALEDYSTTWQPGPSGPVPQAWWSYALGWPRQLRRSADDMRERDAAGTLPAGLAARVRRQKRFLQALFGIMLFGHWPVALAWLATVYSAWVLVSVHNFGQHPPVAYGRAVSTSYRGRFYNRIFCANGLHHEHHRDPALPWDRLVPAADAPRVGRPHLLLPELIGVSS